MIAGWSSQAAARNARFLRAQPREGHSDGKPYAATFTLGRLPPTAADFQRRRDSLLKRLARLGSIRVHWVVEFTARGRPHLHLAIWLPHDSEGGDEAIIAAWLGVADGLRTLRRSQTVLPIHAAGGWFKYVGVHAGRGVKHYQRQRVALPRGWQTCGRMWGYTGGPWVNPDEVEQRTELTQQEWFRYRRLARKLEESRAVADGDRRKVRAARRSLRCADRAFSAVRPASVWTERDGEELPLLAWVIGESGGTLADRRELIDDAALALCESVTFDLAELEQRRQAFALATSVRRNAGTVEPARFAHLSPAIRSRLLCFRETPSVLEHFSDNPVSVAPVCDASPNPVVECQSTIDRTRVEDLTRPCSPTRIGPQSVPGSSASVSGVFPVRLKGGRVIDPV